MYERKTIDVWKIFVNYGQGWEHEHTELTKKDLWRALREYRENVPGIRIKWQKGREKK